MKVIHIITDLNEGGAQTILFRLLSEMNESQKHVVISLIGPGHYSNKLKKLGVHFYCLGMNNKSLNIIKIFKLYKILLKEKPTIVQTWMYHCDLIGGILARLIGVRNIFWGVVAFNLDADVMKFTSRLIIKMNIFFSYFIPKKIIYCAKSAEKIHEKIGFDKKKSVCIPIGFEKKNIKTIKPQLENKNIFTIGCIARWDPQKDHANLFNALKVLDKKNIEYKCIFVGIGMDDNNIEIQNLLKNCGVKKEKISFLGYVNDINKIFDIIDIHVLPSAGEAFPNIIGEAMSIGIPCIGTDVGDVSEIISKDGWVVPRGDQHALANAIIEAKEDFSNLISWSNRIKNSQENIRKNYPLNAMISDYNYAWNK